MSTSPNVDVVAASPSAAPTEPPAAKVPQFNVYMTMLGLALLMIMLACAFLAMELNTYEFKLKP